MMCAVTQIEQSMTSCDLCGSSCSGSYAWCQQCKIALCDACSLSPTRTYAEEGEPCQHDLEQRTQERLVVPSVNTSAVAQKPIDLIVVQMAATKLGHRCEDKVSDNESYVYIVSNNHDMLQRIPKLPPNSRISRFPGTLI